MECSKCGYALSPFDEECPRCIRLAQNEAPEAPEGPEPPKPPKPPKPPAPVTRPKIASYVSPSQPAPIVHAPPEALNIPANPAVAAVAFLAGLGAVLVATYIAGLIGTYLLVLATSLWMGIDANELEVRGRRIGNMSPIAWAFGGLLLWIVALPWYLTARDQHVRQMNAVGALTGLYVYAGVGMACALVVALVFGLGIMMATYDIGVHAGEIAESGSQPRSAPPVVLAPVSRTCTICSGRGSKVCTFCNGAGIESCGGCTGVGTIGSGDYMAICPICGGSGTERCLFCAGRGRADCPFCVNGVTN